MQSWSLALWTLIQPLSHSQLLHRAKCSVSSLLSHRYNISYIYVLSCLNICSASKFCTDIFHTWFWLEAVLPTQYHHKPSLTCSWTSYKQKCCFVLIIHWYKHWLLSSYQCRLWSLLGRENEVAAMTDVLEFSDIYQEVKGSWVSRRSWKGIQVFVEVGEIIYQKCINVVLSELHWHSSNWMLLACVFHFLVKSCFFSSFLNVE